MDFREINIADLSFKPFELISKDWMLITSGDEQGFNTMTASWGGLGVLWHKNVVTVYIRPQRYTYEFVEKNGLLTLSFFGEEHRSALTLCGSKSGRDCDKAKEAGLTPLFVDGTTAFEEANLVLVCKKLYFDDLEPKQFLDSEIEKNYAAKDYHRMYILEIVKAYQK